MSGIERLKTVESLWSLWNLVRDNWQTVLAALVAGGGVVSYSWKYIQLAADLEGWWVYPVVIVLIFGAILALILAARTLWSLMGHPKKAESAPIAEIAKQANPLEEYDGEAHHILLRFASLHLLPACNAQVSLQEAILRQSSAPRFIVHLAHRGLWGRPDYQQFADNYDLLSDLEDSPAGELTTRQLVEIVGRMENDAYRFFCQQKETLAKAVGIDYREHPQTADLWRVWKETHDKMVAAYDEIKVSHVFYTLHQMDLELPNLWRPARVSRWNPTELPPSQPQSQ